MWFVTTLGPIDEEWGPKYSRCVGYFETYSEALECVQKNSLDIAENGYYPYAVVERIRPGLYPDAVAFFFEYLEKINAYVPISFEKLPEVMHRVTSFSIG